MKKLIQMFLLLIMSIIIEAKAITINDNEYTIELKELYFELYEQSEFMYQTSENDYINMYHTPTISQEIVYNENDFAYNFTNAIWKMTNEYNVRILYLNYNTDSYFNSFKNLKPSDDKNYIAVLRLEYCYSQMPHEFNSIYHYKYMENLSNSLIASLVKNETYTISPFNLNDKMSQIIWIAMYSKEQNLWKEYNSIETLSEDNSAGLLMDFDIFSKNTTNLSSINTDDQLYYIHNVPDAEKIKEIYEATYNNQNIQSGNNNSSSDNINTEDKNDTNSENNIENKNNSNNDDTIYGTVENSKTGINNHYILLIIFIITSILISTYCIKKQTIKKL